MYQIMARLVDKCNSAWNLHIDLGRAFRQSHTYLMFVTAFLFSIAIIEQSLATAAFQTAL
jgi:hypothetical protein